MILPDTSIWVDHTRSPDGHLSRKLAGKNVLMHPLVIGELAMGHLRDRAKMLFLFAALPRARAAELDEVRFMIESRVLYGRGIGLVDAHLLASTFINQPCSLWTRDLRLRAVAKELGLHADLA